MLPHPRTPDPSDAIAPAETESAAPETGDIVIDAALHELSNLDPGDLDAVIDRGEHVQRTLQGRLGDLGG